MYFRLCRCLKIIALSLVLSIIFSAIFIKIYLKKYDGGLDDPQQLQKKCSTFASVKGYKSYHIDLPLFARLQKIWSEFGDDTKTPPNVTYNVNVSISDKIPFDRKIPKTRNDACESIIYDENMLGNLCFVIPFYNEPLSLLIRTLHSILNRTPPKLLTEIIIVDDYSSHENLGAPLERYVSLLPKVVLVRNAAREGLIRTRLIGLSKCTAEVVVFQDAHTEVNEGWAQPVLHHLKRHPNHLIQPAIDLIKPENLEYANGFRENLNAQICTFSWDLRYVWLDAPKRLLTLRRSYADPVPTATIVGCSIAVNRQHFIDMGTFDDKMNIWGGENLEVAMRYWQCGGAVLTHPCARVGHVFKPIPFSFGEEGGDKIVTQNLARVAEVWLDSYKPLFYAAVWTWPKRRFNFSDDFITEVANRRAETRDHHHCKNFKWFLKGVAPEVKPPPPSAIWYGEVFHAPSAGSGCFHLLPCGHIGVAKDCSWHSTRSYRQFYITNHGTFQYVERENTCFSVEESTKLLIVSDCRSEQVLRTRFIVAGNSTFGKIIAKTPHGQLLCAAHTIYSEPSQPRSTNPSLLQILFLQSPSSSSFSSPGLGHFHAHESMVTMQECHKEDGNQNWYFTYKFTFKDLPQMLS